MFFLCSINTNQNENTYHFCCLLTCQASLFHKIGVWSTGNTPKIIWIIKPTAGKNYWTLHYSGGGGGGGGFGWWDSEFLDI